MMNFIFSPLYLYNLLNNQQDLQKVSHSLLIRLSFIFGKLFFVSYNLDKMPFLYCHEPKLQALWIFLKSFH